MTGKVELMEPCFNLETMSLLGAFMMDAMDFVNEKPSSIDAEEASYYDFLLDIVQQAEKIDDEMPIQRLKVYLLVMRYPEFNTQELAEKAGMPKSSMSRNLSSLGSWNPTTKKEGYGLVKGREFLHNRRIKFHALTQKGREVRDALLSVIKVYAQSVPFSRNQA
jgi:DNA-binding MarR family transcriptional regulator